jgi:hypothetical protein
MEIFRFLYGIPDVQGAAVETIKEYEKEETTWIDSYNDHCQPILSFLTDSNYLLLIRICNIEEGKFITSGMLGFYGQESLCHLRESVISKQLLMLLRDDINKFIIKHHKNDEFAKLREEELRNRYAYLAGHGRKMLQDLIEDNDCRQIFADVVGTINKLQYIFSTEINRKKREEYLVEAFANETNGNDPKISNDIEDMARKIYKTSIIENEVELSDNFEFPESSKEVLNSFNFNHKLIKFIFFELFVNAKKNRFHYITGSNEGNELKVSIKQESNRIVIKITSTGAKFDYEMRTNINQLNTPVKEKSKYEISSGIELMRDVIMSINSDNFIYVPEPKESGYPKFLNEVKITLRAMQND